MKDFEKLELVSIDNGSTKFLEQNFKPVLSTLTNDDGELIIRIDKLHASKLEDKYILRGEVKAEYIWGNQENNIFTEPVCIFNSANKLLFCSEDTILKTMLLEDLNALLSDNNSTILGEQQNKKYMATVWELYLATHYNADSWSFVIFKNQNSVLAAITKHRGIIFPVALIFFFVIAFWLLHSTDRLTMIHFYH